MSEQPNLGDCLRNLRRQHGWTLQDVSHLTGVAVSTLSKVENDQMSLTYDKLLQICGGLGIHVTEQIHGSGLEHPHAARNHHPAPHPPETAPQRAFLHETAGFPAARTTASPPRSGWRMVHARRPCRLPHSRFAAKERHATGHPAAQDT